MRSTLISKDKSGFTIVELLIVIVVIAILATIAIVAYRGIQARAGAAAVASDLRSTEKAFRLHFTTAGYSTWPREGENGMPSGPSLRYFIDNMAGFSSFMSSPPVSDDGEWQYDNDNGSSKDMPCGDEDEINQGVNIAIKTSDPKIREEVDRIIDGSDGNLCGRFRWFESGSKLGNAYYNLEPINDGSL